MKKRRIMSLFIAVIMIIAAFAFGSTAVGAAEDEIVKPKPMLDYITESIYVEGGKFDTEDSTLENAVTLMYALKVSGKEAKDVEKAKWLPTYSGDISISKYIPKKAGTYIIAFKWSNDTKNEKVEFIDIKPRPAIGKNDVVYDSSKQQITATGTGYQVKIGDDVFYDCPCEADCSDWGICIGNKTGDDAEEGEKPLLFPLSFLPTGGVAQARKAPVMELKEDDEIDHDKSSFASDVIKIKLPSLPKPTKLIDVSKIELKPKGDKKVAKGYFKGFKDGMEVLVGYKTVGETKEEIWKPVTKNMTAVDFEKLFSLKADEEKAETIKDGDSEYKFEIRNAAKGKKAASKGAELKVRKADYNEAAEIKEPTT